MGKVHQNTRSIVHHEWNKALAGDGKVSDDELKEMVKTIGKLGVSYDEDQAALEVFHKANLKFFDSPDPTDRFNAQAAAKLFSAIESEFFANRTEVQTLINLPKDLMAMIVMYANRLREESD